MKIDLQSSQDTIRFAQRVASSLEKLPRAILMLEGSMGAGKTFFTRFLVSALGSADAAVSPTFAIHNTYQTARGTVEHFDLFRIESADDLESAGFWDFFQANDKIVIIEWADRLKAFGLEDQLPRAWPRIRLRFHAPDPAKSLRIVESDQEISDN